MSTRLPRFLGSRAFSVFKKLRTAIHALGLAAACATPSSAQTYQFTALAGPESTNSADGTGAEAQFALPQGAALDDQGNVFVADTNNHLIRTISATGLVRTLAGKAGVPGGTDGVGSEARFNFPRAVAADSAGNLFVADAGNNTVRKITADGTVTTLAGLSGSTGTVDGIGGSARFTALRGIAVDRSGFIYVTDNTNPGARIRKVAANGQVTTVVGPQAQNWSANGIAVDRAGTIYVADHTNVSIRKVTPAGTLTTLAGHLVTISAPGFFGGSTVIGTSGGYLDGTATTALFADPDGLAVDDSGNVFVADRGNNAIRKVTTGGVVTTLAGGPPAPGALFFPATGVAGSVDGTGSAARFNAPTAVAIDNSGNLAVADSANHTIRRITAGGAVTTLAGTAVGAGSNARLSSPVGLAVDDAGNVFTADSANHAILKVSAAGKVTILAGTAGSRGSGDGTGQTPHFDTPRGIARDIAGNLFVADTNNQTIRKISVDGTVTTVAGRAGNAGFTDGTASTARFINPVGVAVDRDGNVYVADEIRLRKITPTGMVTTIAGQQFSPGTADGLGGAAQFRGLTGVAVDRAGNSFVTDFFNHTVRKITSNGVVTTFAGTPESSGATDGLGSSARFKGPAGLAVDANDNLYVADYFNRVIRKVSPDGMVSTLAGTQGCFGGTDTAGLHFVGVALDRSGNLYVSDAENHTVRIGEPDFALTAAPRSQLVSLGAGATLTAAATGLGLIFQWTKNGTAIPGATDASFAIPNASADDMGFYSAAISNGRSTVVSPVAIITVGSNDADRPYTFTTLAGTARRSGSLDGPARTAQFYNPEGVAVDPAGNIYVGDSSNSTLRKISSDGMVSTLAGAPRVYEFADGLGSNARFNVCTGVVVDRGGNVTLVDTLNSVLRRVTASGAVFTITATGAFTRPWGLAMDGQANLYVSDSTYSAPRKIAADGTLSIVPRKSGSTAFLSSPMGIAVDSASNIFVSDRATNTIVKIAPDGFTSTLAGSVGQAGNADGTGNAARFNDPWGLATDADGNVFVADYGNHTIRKITSGGVVTTIAGLAGNAGSADGTGGAARFDSPSAIAVDRSGTLYVADTRNQTIRKGVIATNGPVSRLANLSTRGFVLAAGDLTVGFAIRGGSGKSLLVRAVGPTLGSLGIADYLANPRLDLIPSGASTALNSNDDWAGSAALTSAFAGVGAFALPTTSKDAAILATLSAAGYTASVTSSVAAGSGIAIAEIYERDTDPTTGRLVNLSCRGFVGTGPEALVTGFFITGTAPKNLLIRALGPGLAQFGVTGALADPLLAVIPLGQSFTVASNDNWDGSATSSSAFTQAGAFALPVGSKDAALVVRLPPGGYTVTVSGAGTTPGTALIEIYDLDP